jgi:hypothetical protein
MTSQRNVLYAYSWLLPSGDLANVQVIMDSIRGFCLELGCEEVSGVVVKPDFVGFTAVVPNSGRHEFALTFSPEDSSWKTSSWLRCSSFKEISQVMFQAAQQGIAVRTAFAGMEMCYRRNAQGIIEVEQRPAFDPDTF